MTIFKIGSYEGCYRKKTLHKYDLLGSLILSIVLRVLYSVYLHHIPSKDES